MALPIGTLECRALIMRGSGEPGRFPLDREVIRVGRALDCEIPIDDRFMGQHHCRLVRSQGRFLVEDDASPGGTYLNHQDRIVREELYTGDIVHFGAYRTRIHFEHRGLSALHVEANPLMAAICADPHDEASRAVYADWLGERGDPRGEFIQYQIAAERLPSGDARRVELEARAQVLLERHERAWVQPLPVFVESWRFRHGFVSAVAMDPRAVLAGDDLAALRRVHPIRAVCFIGVVTPELLDELARSPRLEGITQVELMFGMEHEGLAARFGRTARPGLFGAGPRYFP